MRLSILMGSIVIGHSIRPDNVMPESLGFTLVALLVLFFVADVVEFIGRFK